MKKSHFWIKGWAPGIQKKMLGSVDKRRGTRASKCRAAYHKGRGWKHATIDQMPDTQITLLEKSHLCIKGWAPGYKSVRMMSGCIYKAGNAGWNGVKAGHQDNKNNCWDQLPHLCPPLEKRRDSTLPQRLRVKNAIVDQMPDAPITLL